MIKQIDFYDWPKYENNTEYLTLWFINKYKRSPTKEELKSLIDKLVLPDWDRYNVPLNKLEDWKNKKKKYEQYLKNGEI